MRALLLSLRLQVPLVQEGGKGRALALALRLKNPIVLFSDFVSSLSALCVNETAPPFYNTTRYGKE